jgi:3-deoxy-D-manno-octulosonic-acid transferase
MKNKNLRRLVIAIAVFIAIILLTNSFISNKAVITGRSIEHISDIFKDISQREEISVANENEAQETSRAESQNEDELTDEEKGYSIDDAEKENGKESQKPKTIRKKIFNFFKQLLI